MPSKARKKRQAVRPNQTRPIPGWMWLGAGLVLGLGVATGLMLSGTLSTPDAKELPKPNPVAKPKAIPEAPIEQEAAKEPVTYDFYTRLENKQIEQPHPGEVSPRTEAEVSVPKSLQIGSFKQKKDAENMKAELAFLGLIASIESAEIDAVTWHRVKIGPFETSRDMEKVQRKLRDMGLDGLPVRAD